MGNDLADCLMDRNNDSSTEARLELVRNAYNPDLIENSSKREEFLLANGFLIDALDDIEHRTNASLGAAYHHYMNDLKIVAERPSEYQRVVGDPIGVMLYKEVSDKKLRDYYHSTKEDKQHPDWLLEVITQCVNGERLNPNTANSATDKSILQQNADGSNDEEAPVTVGDVVKTAYENHPLFQEMIFDDLKLTQSQRRPVPVVLAIFQDYGRLIQITTSSKYNLPRSDVLDVIFANTDYIEKWLEQRGQSEDSLLKLAAHFTNLYQSKSAVWNEAKYSALALQLHQEAPQDADKVLKEYGSDDIATLIFCGYEDAIPQATKAVAQFGDLAIAILQMYADDVQGSQSRFHTALKNPQIGIRIIPYVASKGDQGLEALDDNIRWLDKYFDEAGNPRGPDVLEAIPFVGAPAKIVKNMLNNHPNSWDEIGWAALDIADVGLTVATFGSSVIVTKTTKAAAKSAIIKSGKVLAKGSSTRQVAKTARTNLGKTLLRRATDKTFKISSILGGKINRPWKYFRYVSNGIYAKVNDVSRLAGRLKQTWSNLPTPLKKAAYSGLLAATLYLKVAYQSIPVIANSLSSLSSFVNDYLDKVITPFTEALSGVVNDFLQPDWFIVGWVLYLIALAVLVICVWKLNPWKRKPLAYA
jgi:hypothetical protein